MTLSTDRTIAISDFGASGGSHARGAVPDPGASAGSTKFLREDATWAVPAGAGGGVTDGDKGDIVVSASGATWTIDPVVLTAAGRALIDDADAAAQRVTLGAEVAGAGVPTGGTAGQPLVKVDGTDRNTAWSTLAQFKTWLALTLSDIATALGLTPAADSSLTSRAPAPHHLRTSRQPGGRS